MILLSFTRGDDAPFVLLVTEKKAPYAKADFSDCTFKLTLRSKLNGPVFLQKDLIITDAVNGEAEVYFDAADTSGLSNVAHDYFFDVEVTRPGNWVETLCKGKFTVEPDVTY